MYKRILLLLAILLEIYNELIEVVFYFFARSIWTQYSVVKDVFYACMYCVIFVSLFFCLDKWLLKKHYIQRIIRRIGLPHEINVVVRLLMVVLCVAAIVFEGQLLFTDIRDNHSGLWGIPYVFAILSIGFLLASVWKKKEHVMKSGVIDGNLEGRGDAL